MTHLKMHSLNKIDENISKIATLFPNCVTEAKNDNGEIVHKIDFDMLKQELSSTLVEGREERYQFTWPDKRQAILTANAPINKTLRPCREESVNFDETENLYIEGDNLEVLKLLQEPSRGKIKMIYIAPPYNTGNDFVYSDQWTVDSEQWEEVSGQWAVNSETGERVRVTDNYTRNTESNGRFHTDWLNMMYPRLKLARDLLSDDGVIFISIDDNEVASVQWLVKEIFGECNFVAQFPWRKRTAKSDVPFGVSQDYEWIICCAKSDLFEAGIEGGTRKYFETDDFPGKPWRIHDLTKQTTASERPNSFFTMVNPKTGEEYPANPNATWRITKETLPEYMKENRIVFPGDYDFLKISKPVLRYWKADDEKKAGDKFGQIAVTTKLPDQVGMSQDGTKEITELLGAKAFPYPKSVELIKYLIKIATANSGQKLVNSEQRSVNSGQSKNYSLTTENCPLILDFFSGSATTAHAVMQLNAEDGGKRKFIMVQLPEITDEKSEAYKAGYKNICEIGKERIRRAGKKISEQWLANREQRIVDSEKSEGGKNGGAKLQGIADMAKGNDDCERDLFASQETAKGRDIRSVRPNETGGCIDSVEHSGGAVKELNEGVCSVLGNSKRVEVGARNANSSLQRDRIFDGSGNTTCDDVVARGKQNDSRNENKTDNYSLTTNHCPLTTNHCSLDIGFRVLKIDTSNMEDVYYTPDHFDKNDLFKSNIKADRTGEDLLFQVMLDLGIMLSSRIETKKIDGKNVFFVEGNYLVACFDENVDEGTITKIAKEKPYYFVMRDSSMANDSVATNFEQIFATYSPETIRKVL